MYAIPKLKVITAPTDKAQAALASLIQAIPAGMETEFLYRETGSLKNREIVFYLNGARVYRHWVKASGYFQAMTSPKLAAMQAAITDTLSPLAQTK